MGAKIIACGSTITLPPEESTSSMKCFQLSLQCNLRNYEVLSGGIDALQCVGFHF